MIKYNFVLEIAWFHFYFFHLKLHVNKDTLVDGRSFLLLFKLFVPQTAIRTSCISIF
uniref:Uncharacterized protein n=1 Tax=Rhizophora mucronata TaxID=61149 RepID=A0A2P2QXR2_RHIMU